MKRFDKEKIYNIFFYALIIIYFFVFYLNKKPIWIDEFLHFAMGSFSLQEHNEVIDVILRSIQGINHGQTGFYFLLDWFLLNIFGANVWALRLPSFFSVLLIFLAISLLAKSISLTAVEKIFLILLYFVNFGLMQYGNEARPYMPLVSAVLLILSYNMCKFNLNVQHRYLAIFAIIWGTLMHPYFFLYMAIISATFLILTIMRETFSINLIKKNGFDLGLLILSGVISLIIARSTWGNRQITFEYDPFEWIGRDLMAISVFFGGNLPVALFPRSLISIIIAGAIYVLILLVFLIGGIKNKNVFIPVILIIISFLTSFIISLVSYLQSYWILPRQWVASSAIVTFAIFWLFKISYDNLSNKLIFFRNLTFFAIILFFAIQMQDQIKKNITWETELNNLISTGKRLEIQDEYLHFRNRDWVELANLNVAKGGKVWSEFRYFYLR